MTGSEDRQERAFRSLRFRDFRLLWAAETLSVSGSYIARAAMAWQIYDLTGSAVSLGLLGLVRFIPLILFGMVGGVIADRGDRKRTLVVSQLCLVAIAGGLGVVTLAGAATIWLIYAVAVLEGSVSSISNPTRQAIVPNLVPKSVLGGAMTMSSLGFQIAGVTGPAIGGLIIAVFGVGWAYLIDGVTFGFVALATLAIRTPLATIPITVSGLAAAKEGLWFLRRTPVLLGVMMTDFAATFLGFTSLLMPLFAEEVFNVGPEGLGLLLAAPAAGSFACSALLSAMRLPNNAGVGVIGSVVVYGLALVGFGLSGSFVLALGFLALSGAADSVSVIYRNAIRALVTPDELRGRVAAVHRTLAMGGPQLGEVKTGFLAALIGAGPAVALGGTLAAVAALVIAVRLPSVPRYRLGDGAAVARPPASSVPTEDKPTSRAAPAD